MLKIIHPIDRPISKGHIIDISPTIKLQITHIVEREEKEKICVTLCKYDVVVRQV